MVSIMKYKINLFWNLCNIFVLIFSKYKKCYFKGSGRNNRKYFSYNIDCKF